MNYYKCGGHINYYKCGGQMSYYKFVTWPITSVVAT